MRSSAKSVKTLVSVVVAVLVIAGTVAAIHAARGVTPSAPTLPDEFELVVQRDAGWMIVDGPREVLERKWRHRESGVELLVKWASFNSSEEARAACEAEVASTQAMASPGTYSGAPLGDFAWHWPGTASGTGTRLMFCSGPNTVSVALLKADLASDPQALAEGAAPAILKSLNRAD